MYLIFICDMINEMQNSRLFLSGGQTFETHKASFLVIFFSRQRYDFTYIHLKLNVSFSRGEDKLLTYFMMSTPFVNDSMYTYIFPTKYSTSFE